MKQDQRVLLSESADRLMFDTLVPKYDSLDYRPSAEGCEIDLKQ